VEAPDPDYVDVMSNVLCLGDDIGEKVLLEIDGFELTCFSMSLSSEAKAGQCCQVELEPMIFNDYVVHEMGEDALPSMICGYRFDAAKK
jgi:hypothetical protein